MAELLVHFNSLVYECLDVVYKMAVSSRFFEVSQKVSEAWVSFYCMIFLLKQFDYSLSVSMSDSWWGRISHHRNLELIIELFKDLRKKYQLLAKHQTYNFPQWTDEYVFVCVVVDAESVLYGVRGNQEIDLDELTFKLIVRSREKPDSGSPYTITLMAPSAQEKAAWTSDICQVTACLSPVGTLKCN